MTKRHFVVFVCTLMICVGIFSQFMQSSVVNPWSILGTVAILVVTAVLAYYLVNGLITLFCDHF